MEYRERIRSRVSQMHLPAGVTRVAHSLASFRISGGTVVALAAALLFIPVLGVPWAALGAFSLSRWLHVAGLPALLVFLVGLAFTDEAEIGAILRRLGIGMATGIIATTAIEVFLWAAVLFGVLPHHPAASLGAWWLASGPEMQNPLPVTGYGYIYHVLLNGAFWAAAYSLVVGAVTWRVGLGYGSLLWLGFMLGTPVIFPGLSSFGLNQGPSFPLFLLAPFLAYGAIVGAVTERWLPLGPLGGFLRLSDLLDTIRMPEGLESALGTALLYVPAVGVLWAGLGSFPLVRWLHTAVIPAVLVLLVLLAYADERDNTEFIERLGIGLAAGIVGVATIESFLWLAVLTGLLPNHPAGILGSLWQGPGLDRLLRMRDWGNGYFYHVLLNGAFWAAAYSLVVGAVTWRVGLGYGTLLWLGFMLDLPDLFPGISSFGLKQGALFPVFMLAAFLVYGAVVGGLLERWLTPDTDEEG